MREITKFVFIIRIELKITLKYFVFGLQINKEIRKQMAKFGCPISTENLTGKDEKKRRVKSKNQFNLFLKNALVRRWHMAKPQEILTSVKSNFAVCILKIEKGRK